MTAASDTNSAPADKANTPFNNATPNYFYESPVLLRLRSIFFRKEHEKNLPASLDDTNLTGWSFS
jgi:hypothetical protein